MATKVGTGYVDIVGNFAPLNKALRSSSLKSRLAGLAKLGAAAGVAIGVASVKAAADFEHSMTLVQTQAGASAREVHKLSDAILNFAASGKTEFGPNELATALYSVESAGIHGAKAM